VFGRFGEDEPGMLELDAGRGAARLEGDTQARGARRHHVVAGLTPCNLDEARSIDANEVPADEHAVDID
jgi:hypothetical protein